VPLHGGREVPFRVSVITELIARHPAEVVNTTAIQAVSDGVIGILLRFDILPEIHACDRPIIICSRTCMSASDALRNITFCRGIVAQETSCHAAHEVHHSMTEPGLQ